MSTLYMEPCRYFAQGTCRWGSRCRFRHEDNNTSPEGQEIARASMSNSGPIGYLEEAFRRWRFSILLPHQPRKALGRAGLARFFQDGLKLVQAGDASTQHGVIKELAGEGGLFMVQELCNAVTAESHISEQLVNDAVKPFLETLIHEDIESSLVLENFVGTIYNFLFGPSGTRAVPVFTILLTYLENTLNVVLESASLTDDGQFSAIFCPCMGVFHHLVELNQTASVNDRVVELAKKANDIRQLVERQDPLMHKASKYLSITLYRLKLSSAIPDEHPRQKPTGSTVGFTPPLDLPGALSEIGPRHENDHVDIQRIKILPTAGEISSNRQEYLPPLTSSNHHLFGIRGLIDRHFRLLREDTVGQLRDAVRLVVERLQQPSKTGLQINRTEHGSRIHVYQDANLSDIRFDKKKGLCILAEFAQPSLVQKMQTQKEREQFWNESKQLHNDSLLCLVDTTGITIFLAVIDKQFRIPESSEGAQPTRREPDLTNERLRAAVWVRTIENKHYEVDQVLRRLRTQNKHGVKQVLVEFPGVLLASFFPTLCALQAIRPEEMPFTELLAPEEVTAPTTLQIRRPDYASSPAFRYSLGSVLKDGTMKFDPGDPGDVQEFRKRTKLDRAQATSFVNALNAQLALIQGPPGTGKSFVGTALIATLRDNREKCKLGPIICVCYTNHALDQILEHLLNDGISKIVRLGGQSKSERLSAFTLNEATAQMERTKTEKACLWEARREIDTNVSEANNLVNVLASSRSSHTIQQHLEVHHPERWQEFGGDHDADGWTTVRDRHKDSIQDWLDNGRTSRKARALSRLESVRLRDMFREERQALFEHWIDEIEDDARAHILHCNDLIQKSKTELDKCYQEVNLRCLHQAQVIGVTTTGLAKNLDLLNRVHAKVVLCEEAGEVLEAHLLTALMPSIEHCILIGDHEQLRPQIQNYDLSLENPRGKRYSLDVSLFERLVRPPDSVAHVPYSTLSVQRRMHPSVANLIRGTIYQQLEDHSSVQSYPEIPGMRQRLYWLDHQEKEASSDETSHSNDFEVEMIAALASHLMRQGVYEGSQIAIITPYLLQLRKIRRRLSAAFEIVVGERDLEDMENEHLVEDPSNKIPDEKLVQRTTLSKALRIATVDNFQGEEADVVLVSLVRSNNERKCGFLRTSNRINVLLSRARHGMYIIGDTATCRHVPMWNQVISMLVEDNAVGPNFQLVCSRHPRDQIEVSTPDDFIRLAPEGGCNRRCEWRFGCGHKCVTKCHSTAMHNATICCEPCPRLKKGCSHPCPRLCGEKCEERCMAIVKGVSLLCGHIAKSVRCYGAQSPSNIRCRTKIKKTVPGCDHELAVDCSLDVTDAAYACKATCGKSLTCGHSCQRRCYECKKGDKNLGFRIEHGSCQSLCGRPFSNCDHNCSKPCHQDGCPPCMKACEVQCSHSKCAKGCSEACAPCAQACDLECPHQGKCQLPCSAPCDLLPCSERCNKNLVCGHQCPSICGEPCPTKRFCSTCAPEDVMQMTVDYLEGKTFAEIDPAETPVIIPTCGHMLTMESLDGLMALPDYYELDENGKAVRQKRSFEPFSLDNLKRCPMCRGSLRKIKRYTSLVKRGLIDEATKKFIVSANQNFKPLEERFCTLEQNLLGGELTLSQIKKVQLHEESASRVSQLPENDVPSANEVVRVEAVTNRQLQAIIRRSELNSRFAAIFKVRRDIMVYHRNVSEAEQPFGRVRKLVEEHNALHNTDAESSFVSLSDSNSILQSRNRLLAATLKLRCDLAILSDFANIYKKWKVAHWPGKQEASLHLNLKGYLAECTALRTEAKDRQQPMHEVEALVFLARFTALERAAPGSDDSESSRLDALVFQARAELEQALSICAQKPSAAAMRTEVEAAQRMLRDEVFYTAVSNDERRAVYAAMAAEFSGTGHWYYCENRHPFTIGECGMPMEAARCPQCGAPIGGQSHQTAEGVVSAADIESEFGGGVNFGR